MPGQDTSQLRNNRARVIVTPLYVYSFTASFVPLLYIFPADRKTNENEKKS